MIGPPPHWRWFPKQAGRTYAYSHGWTAVAAVLWARHFRKRRIARPLVYLSRRMRVADARCYHWGIVLSQARMRGKDDVWIYDLLLHELMHWAGWGHSKEMYRQLRRIGGSF